MKQTLLSLAMACLIFSGTEAFSQPINCDQPNTAISVNQKVREKTYQYIKLLTDKNTTASKDSIMALAVSYIDIQTDFNLLFKDMQRDKVHLRTKKDICNRYSERLTRLINNAGDYDKRILKILAPQGVGAHSFGAGDVLDIIDWILKKIVSGGSNLYEDLKWNDWDAIVNPRATGKE